MQPFTEMLYVIQSANGIRAQLDHDELIARVPHQRIASISLARPIDINSIHKDEADASCFYDDLTGAKLDPKLVRQARDVEMVFFYAEGVYDCDTIGNAIQLTGKTHIVVRWADIDNSDDENPDYRSRLVAKEATQAQTTM